MSDTSKGRSRRLGWKPLRYSVDVGDEVKIVEPPFVVAVIANLSGSSYSEHRPQLHERNFKAVDVNNLDDLLDRVSPNLHFTVEDTLGIGDSGLSLDLHFRRFADFRPENVIMQVPHLHKVYQLRSYFSELMLNLEIRRELVDEFESWELSEEKRVELLSFDFEYSEDYAELEGLPEGISDAAHYSVLHVILSDWKSSQLGIVEFVNARLSELDKKLSAQVDLIIHHPEFMALEATWRGLEYLARETEVSDLLKLRVLNVSKREVFEQYDKCIEIDRSVLFKKLFDDEVGVMGGEPYGLIVCDFDIALQREDISLLDNLAHTAAICRAPVLMSASPDLFSLTSWSSLSKLHNLTRLFESADYLHWRAFRQTLDASFVSLVLPRLLARIPWDSEGDIRQHGFLYTENCGNDENDDHFSWMSGAFGLASVIVNAFARDRWCADLRGPRWGRIEGIPAHHIHEGNEIYKVIGPSELDFSERRLHELAALGFVSLSRHKSGEFAAVHTPTSVAEQKLYTSQEANDCAYHAIQLEHQLCVGRVWNVIRSYLSHSCGQYDNWEVVSEDIERWLREYCVGDDKDNNSQSKSVFVAPFKSVDVKIIGTDKSQPHIQVRIELNYIPQGKAIASMLFVHPPTGVLSARLIP